MSAIRLNTPVPGPRSRALGQRRTAAVAGAVGQVMPIFVDSADGASLTDVDGNVFIDFAGGIGSVNLGHSNPRVVQAITEQAGRFTHACFQVTPYESYVALAEKLNELAPGDTPKKSALFSTGAEAVENAVKIARWHTGRQDVVAFDYAFHGRTYLTMNLTGKVAAFNRGLGPSMSGVHRIPYPHAPRRHDDAPAVDRAARYDEILDRLFATEVDPAAIAALIIEPVLGEGGPVVAPPEALRAIAAICRRHGIVLIVDEIQTGFYRTGKAFAIEWSGVEPDLLLAAKSIASGVPLSAVIGKADLVDSLRPGALGGTYAGNPIACRAALATIAEMERLRLGERASAIGREIDRVFGRLFDTIPVVGDYRGLGAMYALEFVTDKASGRPNPSAATDVQRACLQRGLIVLTSGPQGNVLRTLMPLTITDDQLKEGLDVLVEAVSASAGSGPGIPAGTFE